MESLGVSVDCAELLWEFKKNGYAIRPFPFSIYESLLALAKRFYNLAVEQRWALSAHTGADFLGYIPSEIEVAMEGLAVPVFSGIRERGYSSFDFVSNPRAFARSGIRCSNKWPQDTEFVRQARKLNYCLSEYLRAISFGLLRAIGEESVCKIRRQDFSGLTCSTTRLLQYDVATGIRYSKAHTDYEFVSLVISDGVGLEILEKGGSWISTGCPVGGCVLLPGDIMGVASDQFVPATRHRVRFGEAKRLSIVAFQAPKYGTKIPYPERESLIPFGEHFCGMKVRGTPHLERAFEEGLLVLRFPVPVRNPLAPQPQ